MSFKKTLLAMIRKNHNQKKISTQLQSPNKENNQSEKENYINLLQSKYRKNNYVNIPYIESQESAKFVLDNWNSSAPVPREYMQNFSFEGNKFITGEVVLLWWLTSRKNINDIPLYFSREYGINFSDAIEKLEEYNLLSKDKKLTSDGKRLLNLNQDIIDNHKSSKSWFRIGPVKYFHGTGNEASEIEESSYKDYLTDGIDQYTFMATLDTKTCSTCGNLDRKIFDIKEKKTGINYPLIHPGCRCITTPYFNGMPAETTRWARNPKTGKGEYIDNISFNEWKKTYNLK